MLSPLYYFHLTKHIYLLLFAVVSRKVGMMTYPKLLLSKFPVIMPSRSLLIRGKTTLVALVSRMFGISSIAAIQVDLLLVPGGEFAFCSFLGSCESSLPL